MEAQAKAMNPVGGPTPDAVPKPDKPKEKPAPSRKDMMAQLLRSRAIVPETAAVPAPVKKAVPPPPAETASFDEALERQAGTGNVPIDRAKNLGTILKFLEMTDSAQIRAKLKDIIAKSLH